MANNEFSWDDLLMYMEERQVVPIIGQDLLTVSVNGQRHNAYRLLGQRLMDDLKLPRIEGNNYQLNQVVADHLGMMDDSNKVFTSTKRAFDALKLPVPDALRALARIPAFRLFVTTTFDPWMKQALDEERFGGRSKTELVAYNPRDASDLREEQLRADLPIVYQLFGRICGTPGDYAVTEEDLLEFFHHLQVRPPKLLCDELKDSHLLFIGNAFPDWLARFFLRTARMDRLSAGRNRVEFVVEHQSQSNNPLTQFFRHFSRQTKFYSVPPEEFVQELAARWEAAHPAETPAAGPLPASQATVPPEQCIFISYAREDLVVARQLRQALEQAGLNTWMDEHGLAGGEDWKAKLQELIKRCALFMPVVSQNTETKLEGQYREEWHWATQRLPRFKGTGREFIIPVTVDQVNLYSAKVPDEFKQAHTVNCPGGRPPDSLLLKLREVLREHAGYAKGVA